MAEKYTPGSATPLSDPRLAQVAGLATEYGLVWRASLPAEPLSEQALARLDEWFERGRDGEMDYLRRGRPVMASLQDWKPWARSAAFFSLPYSRPAGGFREGGRVARYALGRDYHHVLGRRLERFGKRLRAEGLVQRFRAATDAAPVLEREWALRANLGFRGKNTLLLHAQEGPWQVLGELLVDAEWPATPQTTTQPTCGTCTRCLDACPTNAFPEPYQLDARRCIAYLTIEHRGAIPLEMRSAMGDWVFGCDVCLEVCPFGSSLPSRADEWGTLPALEEFRLEDLLTLDAPTFDTAFRGSPIRRAGWTGLLRNACIALGNLRRGAPELQRALDHAEPLVRGHAAWALGQLGERRPLEAALARESDPEVRSECRRALDEL